MAKSRSSLNPDRQSKTEFAAAVLKLLRDGTGTTKGLVAALSSQGWGGHKAPARISEMRDLGWNIEGCGLTDDPYRLGTPERIESSRKPEVSILIEIRDGKATAVVRKTACLKPDSGAVICEAIATYLSGSDLLPSSVAEDDDYFSAQDYSNYGEE